MAALAVAAEAAEAGPLSGGGVTVEEGMTVPLRLLATPAPDGITARNALDVWSTRLRVCPPAWVRVRVRARVRVRMGVSVMVRARVDNERTRVMDEGERTKVRGRG